MYLFLTRNYQTIDLIFIRHHTVAKEVGEQEFFYSRETGGTVVSSALELMRDIVRNFDRLLDFNRIMTTEMTRLEQAVRREGRVTEVACAAGARRP